MKGYRKIKKSDKIPALPNAMKPVFIAPGEAMTLIFAEDKNMRYTIIWDNVSPQINEIYQESKGRT